MSFDMRSILLLSALQKPGVFASWRCTASKMSCSPQSAPVFDRFKNHFCSTYFTNSPQSRSCSFGRP